jgi:hypothetical protein
MSAPHHPSADVPLALVDAGGQALGVDCLVTVLSVASCARGLPTEDQDRLGSIVGQARRVIRLDKFGFVWLSFDTNERSDDFCLLPSEVQVASVP